ncbi:MAG: folate-binding protein [Cellvibrionaceae bacterium]|nr:folate-binding protein [Cellvibrionaceae bacterium]
MNEWLEFVSAHSPTHRTDVSTIMMAMPEHRILQVKGRDAATFLQGQLTCDLRRLEQKELLLGAHCNPKGRMISSLVLARTEADTVGMRVRANIAEPALAALKKYIVFSKATISQTEQVGIALLGDFPELPVPLPPPGSFAAGSGLTLLHHKSGVLEIWAEPAQAMALWQQLLPSVNTAPTTRLERHWAEHGIAEVQAATAEEFVPQMFNYHLVDAISFKKGCYTGQEIVARMHYKGQLKKHLYRILGEAADGPVVGAELVTGDESEKAVAIVVASAPGPAGWTGLVVTTDEIRSSGAALQGKNSNTKLTWSELPYAPYAIP